MSRFDQDIPGILTVPRIGRERLDPVWHRKPMQKVTYPKTHTVFIPEIWSVPARLHDRLVMSCLHCFLSSAVSSAMFNFLMTSSTTLLKVFFVLPTGLLCSSSISIALVSMLFSSLHFMWPNHLNLISLNLYSRVSTSHLLTLLLTCISTFYDQQLARSLSSVSISDKFLQHTADLA